MSIDFLPDRRSQPAFLFGRNSVVKTRLSVSCFVIASCSAWFPSCWEKIYDVITKFNICFIENFVFCSGTDTDVFGTGCTLFSASYSSWMVNGQRLTALAYLSLRSLLTLPERDVGISGCPLLFNTYVNMTFLSTYFFCCKPAVCCRRIPSPMLFKVYMCTSLFLPLRTV